MSFGRSLALIEVGEPLQRLLVFCEHIPSEKEIAILKTATATHLLQLSIYDVLESLRSAPDVKRVARIYYEEVLQILQEAQKSSLFASAGYTPFGRTPKKISITWTPSPDQGGQDDSSLQVCAALKLLLGASLSVLPPSAAIFLLEPIARGSSSGVATTGQHQTSTTIDLYTPQKVRRRKAKVAKPITVHHPTGMTQEPMPVPPPDAPMAPPTPPPPQRPIGEVDKRIVLQYLQEKRDEKLLRRSRTPMKNATSSELSHNRAQIQSPIVATPTPALTETTERNTSRGGARSKSLSVQSRVSVSSTGAMRLGDARAGLLSGGLSVPPKGHGHLHGLRRLLTASSPPEEEMARRNMMHVLQERRQIVANLKLKEQAYNQDNLKLLALTLAAGRSRASTRCLSSSRI